MIGRDLIRDNLGWAIGNGENVLAWKVPWLSSSTVERPMGPATEASEDMKVAELFKENSREWNKEKIEEMFPILQGNIMAIKPSKLGGEDKLIWLKHDSGSYTAKTGYYAALGKLNPAALEAHFPHQDWLNSV